MVAAAAAPGAAPAAGASGYALAGAEAGGPAEQPPFGGAAIPELVPPSSPDRPPPGFSLSAARAIAIADGTAQVREQRDDRGELAPTAATRGAERWEVRYRDEGGTVRALVVVDDGSGEVVEAWTGAQIETKLARGYEDAVAGDLNEWWFWLPLCLAFFAPFFDPRRPLRLLHLDLLALVGVNATHIFFKNGEKEATALLV